MGYLGSNFNIRGDDDGGDDDDGGGGDDGGGDDGVDNVHPGCL